MSVPRGGWPRLQQGANFREPLTWDLLQALALMDAAAGDGGDFWGAYADSLLPAPEGLTLPLCWEEPLLAELQHGAIAAAARAQQERLRGLFPGLARSSSPGVPSWLQWGFACVRSRAFKVGEEAWASIPFLDMANHAPDPNSDFLGDIGRQRDGGAGGTEPYRLVALRDIRAGEEVTISYSGPKGYANQRFMAQYGFVPRDGNAADRLPLELPEGATLSLERIEDVLGDALLMDAAQGRNPYLFAALKSLPLLASTDPSAAAASGPGKGSSGGVAAEEAALATQLLSQLEAAAAEGAETTLAEDEVTLSRLEAEANGGSGEGPDCRLATAVRYRLERKRLLQAGRVVLAAYARGSGSANSAAGPAAAA